VDADGAHVVRDRVVQVAGDGPAFGLRGRGHRLDGGLAVLLGQPLDLGGVAAAPGGVPAQLPRQDGVGEHGQDVRRGRLVALDDLRAGHADDQRGEHHPGGAALDPGARAVGGDDQPARVADAVVALAGEREQDDRHAE
jgi:hypothetical protein